MNFVKSFSQSKFGHTGRVQDPTLLRSEGLKIIQAAMAACEPCIDIHLSGSALCT